MRHIPSLRGVLGPTGFRAVRRSWEAIMSDLVDMEVHRDDVFTRVWSEADDSLGFTVEDRFFWSRLRLRFDPEISVFDDVPAINIANIISRALFERYELPNPTGII